MSPWAARGQPVAPIQHHLSRVLRQACRIVVVGIAADHPEQPLLDQVHNRMLNFVPSLAIVTDVGAQLIRQAQSLVARFQQNRSVVGTAVPLVELHRRQSAE